MIPATMFAPAAAEGGTSASSIPVATNAPGSGGSSAPGAGTSGIHPSQGRALGGRAGDTPSPVRRPAIFPLLPRFTWLLDDEPTTFEVCVTVAGGRVEVIARDALAAAGLELGEYSTDPACSSTPYAAHADARGWSFELCADILAVVDDQPRPAAFLRWLEQRMHDLHKVGVHHFERPEAQRAYDVDEHGTPVKTPEHFSIREAARILDRDPVISLGQGRLFELLATYGWIRRDGNVWRPAPGIPARGLLAVQDVAEKHYSRHEPYPQVIVTVAGLHELQRRLGGTSVLDLTPHPALIEE